MNNDRTQTELTTLVDLLTTNKTGFFREPQHFEYLRQDVLPRLHARGGDARFWSAACSSGEEPYTLAMLIAEQWAISNAPRARILATDLSTRMLAKAAAAEYADDMVCDLGRSRIARHMDVVGDAATRRYRIK